MSIRRESLLLSSDSGLALKLPPDTASDLEAVIDSSIRAFTSLVACLTSRTDPLILHDAGLKEWLKWRIRDGNSGNACADHAVVRQGIANLLGDAPDIEVVG